MNHYKWLDRNFPAFLSLAGGDFNRCPGIVSCHADKCYSYKRDWKDAGIPFEHGVAIFLLTYLNPWADEVYETPAGWVNSCDWVIANYSKFASMFDGMT